MQNTLIYADKALNSKTITQIPTKLNEFINTIINKSNELLNTPTQEELGKIDWSSITAILGTISIILIITVIALITLYLLRSIGLYVMAKREGKDFAWIAFVPFGCLFSYGLITGKTKIFGIEIDHPEFVLPALIASTFLPYIGCLGTILFILAKYAMLYKVYQTRTPNFAAVLLILSILFPFLSPIVLFSIRNK